MLYFASELASDKIFVLHLLQEYNNPCLSVMSYQHAKTSATNVRMWSLLSALWIAAMLGGFAVLNRYATLPGGFAVPPPAHSVSDTVLRSSLSLAPAKPVLLMFAHPRCPCTQASLSEFARIVARCRDKATFRILFFAPSDKTPSEALAWVQSDNLWKRARAINGVEVAMDVGGQEAQRFNAKTSGHTVLYDAQGTLLFYGGITPARGHEGDNDGKNAIISALLDDARAGTRLELSAPTTPTFGCAIQRP